ASLTCHPQVSVHPRTMQGSEDPYGVDGVFGLGELMNETSNDGNEPTDPTEGILADLADLQQSVNAKDSDHEDVDGSVRARLDDIAAAAESLRTGDADDEDDDDEDTEERDPSARRTPPKSARDAVANRGLVFEEYVRGDESSHRDSEDRKSTRLNSSHVSISYAVFCLK